MSDIVKLDIKGLKCDNPECTYINNNIAVEDYYKWVNKKCPICGDILLTEEDFGSVNMLIGFSEIVNKINVDVDCANEEKLEFKINMNGSGIMDLEEIKHRLAKKNI